MSDYIQVARIRGHQENKKINIYQDDFFTICQKNTKLNIGLRKKSKNKSTHLPVFKKENTSVDYLCSDLVRFCLSFYKNHCNLYTGEMALIPKEPITISKELQEYIEEFLPDYYGIRDTVK